MARVQGGKGLLISLKKALATSLSTHQGKSVLVLSRVGELLTWTGDIVEQWKEYVVEHILSRECVSSVNA